LTSLDVDGNELASLDVTKNRALKGLICSNNRLTSLDLSACTALTSLEVDGNELAALDLSKNNALITLNCNMNRLAALDISKNAALESLFCDGNRLVSIDLGAGNARLEYIRNTANLLSAEALNTLFEKLPYSGTIALQNNPGTSTCNLDLVVRKNWVVQPD
jgi:hypothetical protein